jgi:transcriptional regulator with XRE-family HTH domain
VKLNERITRWRESRGLTKSELARRVEVSSAAVAQWENPDGTEPTHKSVEAIAKALDISLSQFWGDPPKRKAKAS